MREVSRRKAPVVKSIVELRCFKKWCHKSYKGSLGQTFATYTRIPPVPLEFQSPMVNDENQELCNGWEPDWLATYPGGDTQATIDRVRQGLKPMGFVYQWKDDQDKSIQAFIKAVKSCRYHTEPKPGPNSNFLVAAVWQQGNVLGQLFDFGNLAYDYATWTGGMGSTDVLFRFENARLADFVEKWDVDDGVPIQITGLILGYPVENTISVMLGGIK